MKLLILIPSWDIFMEVFLREIMSSNNLIYHFYVHESVSVTRRIFLKSVKVVERLPTAELGLLSHMAILAF